jgi:hypothetical protein
MIFIMTKNTHDPKKITMYSYVNVHRFIVHHFVIIKAFQTQNLNLQN